MISEFPEIFIDKVKGMFGGTVIQKQTCVPSLLVVGHILDLFSK
jgi:hypothetical protein